MSRLKYALLGPAGPRPRLLRRGLLRGLSFTVDTAHKSQRLLGLDEAEITGVVRREAAAAASAVDVGANDGWYTLFLASRPNLQRVLAFEPEATFRYALRTNLGLNDPAAAAKVDVRAEWIGDHARDGWETLDRATADLPRPVLLKIDVDGGELDVLRGATGLLAAGAARLVVETHSADLERDCLALVRGYGYDARVIGQGWYRRVVPERRELPHNRWFVAVPPGGRA